MKVLLLILLALTFTPSTISSPTVTQRVYHYGASPRIQTDVGCGASTDAELVYVEINLHALGVNTRSLTDGVSYGSLSLWEQTTPIAVHPETGNRMVARYFQRLLSPGDWVFTASVPGSDVAVCVVHRV